MYTLGLVKNINSKLCKIGNWSNAYRVSSWKSCRSTVVQTPNSLGIPRLSISQTPNFSFQNAKQRYTRIFCQFPVHSKKSVLGGILKAYQNLEGDCWYYLFFPKKEVSSLSKCHKRYSIDFPDRLPYLNQFAVHSTTKKNERGYRCTGYCHGVLLYGERKPKVFLLSWL